jgi:HEAT repeat protein
MPLIRKGANEAAPPPTPDAEHALAALRSGSADERWAAVRSLVTHPASVAALSQALGEEKDDRVREAIFTGLAKINSAASVEAVLPYLRVDDATLRTGALDALKAMPGAVRARLESLLRDADPDVRILACDLARGAPPEDATRLLSSILGTDASANVCAAAVDVLAEIGLPAALASLERCAHRFPNHPFLGFAVKVAAERIGSQLPKRHG